jgi:hypothetical protein
MKPATDWKESVPPGEAERFERYAEELCDMQRRRGARVGRTDRALHAKGKAGVEAELSVIAGLPDYARVGIFAEPATYRAYARFSNGSGSVQHDGKADVRGAAVKVLGVPGQKIISGLEDATTQDFLFITTPSIPFRDAQEFVGFVRTLDRPLPGLSRLVREIGARRTLSLVRTLAKGRAAPLVSVATSRYYSAAPVKFGPYAVHYALVPHAPASASASPGTAHGYLGEELSRRLRAGAVTYDFRIQFYVDARRTPIEDASAVWREDDAPFLTVARLTLPQQDPTSARGRRVAALCEAFSFDPWHAPQDFRPLGNVMRARNHAYRLSTQERRAAKEPDGTEELPPR